MGRSAAGANQFWELFTRAAASDQLGAGHPARGRQQRRTGRGRRPGFAQRRVPVQPRLTFSPLAVTSDAGKTWRTGLIDAPVASDPDALAIGAGVMLALLGDGTVEQGGTADASWTRLAAPGAIASFAAGRQCHVTSVTAVAYTPIRNAARRGLLRAAGHYRHLRPFRHSLAGGLPVLASARRAPGHGAAAHRYPAGDSRCCRPGRGATRSCSPPGRATEAGGRSQPRWLWHRASGCLRTGSGGAAWVLLADAARTTFRPWQRLAAAAIATAGNRHLALVLATRPRRWRGGGN